MIRPWKSTLLAVVCTAGLSTCASVQQSVEDYWKKSHCPDIKGDIIAQQYQLYPENLDFDFSRCLIFFGSLFNSSVTIYSPYKNKTVDILTFPNITHNPEFHLGGVGIDPLTKQLSIVVDAGAAFNTGGQDSSGTNYYIRYDLDAHKVITQVNLTKTSKGRYGGFQDVEHDKHGNAYVVGSFPASILRVKRGGSCVEEWYVPPVGKSPTPEGFGGLATVGDVLLTNDVSDGQIKRFNLNDPKGTPVVVPHYPNTTIGQSDAIYLPPKYGGTVLLVAEDAAGISVLRSKDRLWTSATYLGLVPNTGPSNTFVTAPMQIGQSLYMNLEVFTDPPVSSYAAGNRSSFTLLDITSQVDKLVKGDASGFIGL